MKRTASELSALMRLLDEALELPEGSRHSWLKSLPEQYAALAPSLEQLLLSPALYETGEVANLENRVADFVRGELHGLQLGAQLPGARVGPYVLERQIGEGGMGSVWLAQRADGAFTLQVALKLPLTTWLGQLAERMSRERDILAALQHENIARFLDAGFDAAGRPFLAMEYVEGVPLDEYCIAHKISLRDRLQLMLQVAKALAYAHSKLVIHRDLKPRNILVTADGRVKLLDFGVATLLEQDGTHKTRLTHITGRALTIDYASPEHIRGEIVGTATDVYSMAVVLYELLAGCRPYRLKNGTAGEIERAIAETDPRPASEVAADPAFKRQLRGDLDAILNKAMKKSPAERYATIAAFAEDIERHLNDIPVLARPDDIVYKSRKFMSRHVLPLSVAALVLVSILGGGALALWQAHSARTEAARAKATKDYLLDIFRSNDRRVASDQPHAERTVKQVLDAQSSQIEDRFEGNPDMQLELLGLTAVIYENQQDLERYRELQQRRLKIAIETYGPWDESVIEVLLEEADSACAYRDFTRAGQLLEDSDYRIKKAGRDDTVQRADWYRIKSRMLNGTTSDQTEADRALDQALAIYRQRGTKSIAYAEALDMAARVQLDHGDSSRALPLMTQALQVAESAPDIDYAFLSGLIFNLARKQEAAGEFAAAAESYRRAQDLAKRTFGVHHRNYWAALAWNAQLLHKRGDRAGAQALFSQLLRSLPPQSTDYDVEKELQVYAECLAAEGNPQQAIPLLETAYQTFQKTAAFDFDVRDARYILGDAYDRAGRTQEARAMLQASYLEVLAKEQAGSRFVMRIRERWGRFLLDHAAAGGADVRAAKAEFQAVVVNAGHPFLPWTALAYSGLARIAYAEGDFAAASASSQLALWALAKIPGLYDLRTEPRIWLVHSAILLQAGDAAGALDWAVKARDASVRFDDPGSASIQQANDSVAQSEAYIASHRTANAKKAP